jgi:hypothetical protein
MLTLKLNQRKLLKLDIAVEEVYSQILSEIEKLHPQNFGASEFLRKLKGRLLRKAAKTLIRDTGVTGYRFVHNPYCLDITRDSTSGIVSCSLETFQQP